MGKEKFTVIFPTQKSKLRHTLSVFSSVCTLKLLRFETTVIKLAILFDLHMFIYPLRLANTIKDVIINKYCIRFLNGSPISE